MPLATYIHLKGTIIKNLVGMLIKKLRIWIQKRQQQIAVFRSSHRRCSVKTVVNRNFAKFTGKHLWQSLYFNKLAGLACNFVKKETLAQVFSIEFCEISENTFSIFAEYVWAASSKYSKKWNKVTIFWN